jgi:hypothetical protein
LYFTTEVFSRELDAPEPLGYKNKNLPYLSMISKSSDKFFPELNPGKPLIECILPVTNQDVLILSR